MAVYDQLQAAIKVRHYSNKKWQAFRAQSNDQKSEKSAGFMKQNHRQQCASLQSFLNDCSVAGFGRFSEVANDCFVIRKFPESSFVRLAALERRDRQEWVAMLIYT